MGSDQSLSQIKIVSFDLEGTLVTPVFSQVIWHEAIPVLFAEKNGISLEQAKAEVVRAYREVGEQRKEWYDIKYWFSRFDLTGYEKLLVDHRQYISYYPEVSQVLASLSGKYDLIVVSNSTREFLEPLTEGIRGHFKKAFSTLSDFGELKCSDCYFRICRLLRIEPWEMVHAGDSREFDFDIPKEVGIRAFHLAREDRGRSDEVIGDLSELAKKLLEGGA